MVNYKKSLQRQSTYIPMDEDRGGNPLAAGFLILIGLLLGVGGSLLVRSCDKEPQPAAAKLNCAHCHNKMAHYFRHKNVKSPEKMAEAVLRTRNPRLLAAVNVGGEKKTPHTAMKTGWKRQYSGAWQTHERWGKITKNTPITEQALIAELALETHVSEQKNIIKGLNAYGGESDLVNGKYAYNVLEELKAVPK